MRKKTEIGKKNQIRLFLLAEVLLGVGLFGRFYEAWVNRMDSTVLAFSYKYGFISRGLVGTFYQWLDEILPADLMNQEAVVTYTLCVTLIFYVLMLGFFGLCLYRADTSVGSLMCVIVFFTVFAVPISSAHFNFGRPDIYCLILSTAAAILLIVKRAEWLVVPLAALGVMIHQGNVFMYLNIILMLLLYRVLSTVGRERKKYVFLLSAAFLAASALFLYFEFFSHVNGEEFYPEIVNTAQKLTKDGKIHQDLVDKEILGIDLTDREEEDHRANFVQLGVFLLLMLPYILILIRFFRRLIKNAKTKTDQWKYVFAALGAGTILPDLLLKIDYGRWMFAVISYYCIVILAMSAMGDEGVFKALTPEGERTPACKVAVAVLLVYPLLLQPLEDVNINYITEAAADYINDALGLGWW